MQHNFKPNFLICNGVKKTSIITGGKLWFIRSTPLIRDGGVECCVGGYPEWRANGSWTALTEKWSATDNMQLIGSATDWNGAPGAIGTEIDAVFYHNLQGSYQLSGNVELRLGIDNVLDEDAPHVRSWSDGNTDTMTYSFFGRFVYARAVLKINWLNCGRCGAISRSHHQPLSTAILNSELRLK